MGTITGPVTLPKVFYGWWIVLAGTVLAWLNGGVNFYGFQTFFLPLTKEFGWSRASLAGVVSLARLEGGIMAPVVGYLVDRLGPRKLMVVGFTISGIGFILFSKVDSLLMLYGVFIFVMSTGQSLGAGLPPQTAVANWFIRRRARALAFLAAGSGFGGTLVPVLQWFINSFGWRAAAVVCALLIWVISLPMSFVIRHRPEPYGYYPDNIPLEADDPSASKEISATKVSVPLEVDFTPREAITTRAFWLLALAWGFWTMVLGILSVHILPFLVDSGFSSGTAASIVGLFAVISALSRLGIGWLGDYLSKRYLMAACLALQAIGLLLFSLLRGLWQLIPYLVIFAAPYGGTIALRGAIQGEYFGRKAFGTISGMLRVVDLPGTVAGPLFAGWVFDVTGSYTSAFLVIAFLNILGALAVLAAVRPLPRGSGMEQA